MWSSVASTPIDIGNPVYAHTPCWLSNLSRSSVHLPVFPRNLFAQDLRTHSTHRHDTFPGMASLPHLHRPTPRLFIVKFLCILADLLRHSSQLFRLYPSGRSHSHHVHLCSRTSLARLSLCRLARSSEVIGVYPEFFFGLAIEHPLQITRITDKRIALIRSTRRFVRTRPSAHWRRRRDRRILE